MLQETDESSPQTKESGNDVFCEANGATEEKCEPATYESAILSYENRMKSLTNGECRKTISSTSSSSTSSATTTAISSFVPRKFGRRGSTTKIEEKLSELERIKSRSVSSTDLTETNKKQINIPKVNIFQRKEMFEKICDSNETVKNRKPSDELSRVRTIKERLSSLEKQVEETTSGKAKNVPVTEVSVKDRLSSINEKMRQQSTLATPEKSTSPKERAILTRSSTAPVVDECEKERKPTEYDGRLRDTSAKAEEVLPLNGREYNSSGRSSSSEDYEHVHQVNHFHHRSLDSLQGHDAPNGFCFERVQSLECIDCCSNYPASVLSGDTDREDSGIHTADVSSSVSQADDFDLHADSSMDAMVDAKSAMTAGEDGEPKVGKSSHEQFRFISQTGGSLDGLDKRDDDNQKTDPRVLDEPVDEVDSRTHFTRERDELLASHFVENQKDDDTEETENVPSRLVAAVEERQQPVVVEVAQIPQEPVNAYVQQSETAVSYDVVNAEEHVSAVPQDVQDKFGEVSFMILFTHCSAEANQRNFGGI